MAGFHHADPILDLCLFHLAVPELVKFAACCRAGRDLASHRAESLCALMYDGVQLRKNCAKDDNALARFFQLKASLRPRCLARGSNMDWPDKTVPFKFALESKGPFFVECRATVAKADNGSPLIGLVDADAPWCGKDISNSFAVAFSPDTGHMKATIARGSQSQLIAFDDPIPSASAKMVSARAKLAWRPVGNAQEKWNKAVDAGIYVENGNLSFYRVSTCGCWHSSGIICQNLPARVLPCIFMRSFMGFTDVRFVRIWDSLPELCPNDPLCQDFDERWVASRW